MPWIGLAVCVLAAYRLSATPLFSAAAVVAALNAACLAGRLAAAGRGRVPPRAAVAATHVSAALGAFFLFVSFAMP